jgi:hypothetical protein
MPSVPPGLAFAARPPSFAPSRPPPAPELVRPVSIPAPSNAPVVSREPLVVFILVVLVGLLGAGAFLAWRAWTTVPH